MARLKLQLWPSSSYQGPITKDDGPWKVGEVREVSAEVAGYLLGTFGGAFVRVRKADPGPDLASVLDQSSRKAIAAIKGLGASDLRSLRDIEAAGKGRKTVLAAIESGLTQE